MPTKSRSNNKPTKQNPVVPAAPTSAPPPAIIPNHQPSMFDNIKAGIGLGIGSSISNRIVDSVFGARTINVVDTTEAGMQAANLPKSQTNKCDYITDDIKFNRCDTDNNEKCNELFRNLYSCQKNI